MQLCKGSRAKKRSFVKLEQAAVTLITFASE